MGRDGGSGVVDPQAVHWASRRARSIAEQLQADAARIAELSEVGWRSVDADRWRHELEDTVEAIRRDAHRAFELADTLREHGLAVERTLATITAARDGFLSALDDARRVLANASGEVSAAAVEQARRVVDRATRMPGPGSMDWLRF